MLAAHEMAQMGSALATGLERLRRPVIVHPGTLAEHVVFLIVSSFLDSASIFRNPLKLTRRSIVVLLAGTATVYHRVTLQPVLVQTAPACSDPHPSS